MKTRLVALEVSLLASPERLRTAMPGSERLRPDVLRSHIETQLRTQGEPLRWAITHIDSDRQTAHVEAVVTLIA